MGKLVAGLVTVALISCVPAASASTVYTQTPQSPYTGSGSTASQGTVQGDVNGDGRPDLFLSDSDDTYLTLLGAGDGSFQSVPASGPFPRTGGTDPWHATVGRFDGDALDDVALVHLNTPGVTVLLAAGGGTYRAATGSPFGTGNGREIVSGDVNGDGRTDIVWTNQAGSLAVLLGTSAGGFTPGPGPLALSPGAGLGIGRIDAGPTLDLAVETGSPSAVQALLNDGTGAFSPGPSGAVPIGTTYPGTPFVADVNRDGSGDVVSSHPSNVDNVVTVVLGSPLGALTPALGSPFASGMIGPYSSSPPTLMGSDDNLDVVATGSQSYQLSVLQGDGSGRLAPMQGLPIAAGGPPFQIPLNSMIADYNGDGVKDVAYVLANTARSMYVLLGRRAAVGDRELRFPPTEAGRASEAQTFHVTNTAAFPISFGGASIAGPDAGDFVRGDDGCSGRTIIAGGGCDIGLRFLPGTTGARNATLTLQQDGDLLSAPLSGTGTAAAAGGGPATLPSLTSFAITNAVFAPVARGGRASAAARGRRRAPRRGTTFQATVAHATRVVIAIERAQPGRRAGGSCARPTRANRRGRRCTRFVGAITLSRAVHDGANALPWNGRIGRKAAKPGSYRATATARANGPTSRARSLGFRIVGG